MTDRESMDRVIQICRDKNSAPAVMDFVAECVLAAFNDPSELSYVYEDPFEFIGAMELEFFTKEELED